MTFFSIVIPTYNRATLISKAISSVLAQTFADWELIIVDDGSTDNTAEVVSGFSDKRIVYVYQQNAERSVARNNGVSNATGRYVCFLDSDDYYLPDRLERLHTYLSSNSYPLGMFYTALRIDNGKNVTIRKELPMYVGNIYDRIVSSIIHSQQVCVSRQIITEHRFSPNFRVGEDMELWLRIAGNYSIEYLDGQDTVVVVDHEDRTVNLRRTNSSAELLKLCRYIFKKPHPGSRVSLPAKEWLLGVCYYGMARYYIYNKQRWQAMLSIGKALVYNYRSPQLKFRINVFLHLLFFRSFGSVEKLIS